MERVTFSDVIGYLYFISNLLCNNSFCLRHCGIKKKTKDSSFCVLPGYILYLCLIKSRSVEQFRLQTRDKHPSI